MEEEIRRERQRAEYMARAAAWQLEKEEAEEAKVSQSVNLRDLLKGLDGQRQETVNI